LEEERRRAYLVAAAVVVAALLAVESVLLYNSLQSPTRDLATRLNMGFLEPVDSLNPYIGTTDAAKLLFSLVYSPLQAVGEDLEPVPDLAVGWYAVPEDDPEMDGRPYGSVWQYNLSRNVVWSDGVQFTANDVVFTLELNADYYDFLWPYRPYSYFIEKAVAVDGFTVRVYFWDKTTMEAVPVAFGDLVSIPILPKHKLEETKAIEIGFGWQGVYPGEQMPIVGTGPFVATKEIHDDWLDGGPITLKANPRYHWSVEKGQSVSFDEVVLRFYDTPDEMREALEKGEIDVAEFPPDKYESISDDVQSGQLKNVAIYSGPKISQYWVEIGFDMNASGPNPSRLDPAIRQAMHMATNKSAIVERFYGGYADEGSTLIPPINSFWHYEPNETEKFAYDLDSARALLEGAGYRDGNGDGIREAGSDSLAVQSGWVAPSTRLSYELVLMSGFPAEGLAISSYLRDVWLEIGITVEITAYPPGIHPTFTTYEYDLMLWSWSGNMDPNYQLFPFTMASWHGWNDIKYSSAAYEENYSGSVSAMTPLQRKAYVDCCQRAFYDDSAYIIIAYPHQTYAWRTDTFTGWGVWSAHPGRSPDNTWGPNELYFDLEIVSSYPPADYTPLLIAMATGASATVMVILGYRLVVYLRRGPRGGQEQP
jgi:peptide/nickel transport system substrate-binding protein